MEEFAWVDRKDLKKGVVRASWRDIGPSAFIKNLISDPNSISSIDLSHNLVSRLSGGLLECANLTELDLSNNMLVDIAGISGLEKLKILNVTRNNLSCLGDLPPLLEELNASGNNIKDLPRGKYLETLQSIRLSKNRFGEFPVVLGGAKRLKMISLFSNQITKLPAIECFEASVRMNITWLDLSENPIFEDGEIVRQFCKAFPNGLVDVSVPDKVCPLERGGGNLYIGPEGCAKNIDVLLRHGISNVLSVCHFEPIVHENVNHLLIQINDSPEENISKYFRVCFDFIESAKGSVLVHCSAGVSRSGSIVCAYLMRKNNMSLDGALELLRAKRPCVDPNSGFVQQLRDYEKTLFG